MILLWVGGLAALAVVAALGLRAWGAALPEEHIASAGGSVPAPPEAVFQRIAEVSSYPRWRRGLKSVQDAGEGRWVEDGPHGRIPYLIVETLPPLRRVVRIDTETLPFAGTWTYALHPTPDGTRVEITEHGRVKSALFRALGRLFFPHDKTMREFLEDLRRSFR